MSTLTYTNGTTSNRYFYVRDILLNIIGLKDVLGNLVVRYNYDAWGNILSVTGSEASTVGQANPFRYKGYYYDTETMMYYCHSRYYVPGWCRWLNADDPNYLQYDSPKGANLFAYCRNNPIMYFDVSGHFATSMFLIGLAFSLLIGVLLSKAFGNQVAGGIGSTANGATAMYTGICLLGFGPIGWIAGGFLILVGTATVAFGVNEIVAGVTGTNYIQSWTGMSDGLYNGIYIGLNTASTIGTITGSIYMNYANVSGSKPGTQGKPFSRYSVIDDRGVKQFRFFDASGNAWYDMDFRHAGTMRFPHYHGWESGLRLNEHWSFWELLNWLF